MAETHNPYAPPRASLEHGAREGYWREGNVLVAFRGSALPPRCVKCNEPAHEPTKSRKMYWHHPAIYLVLVLNVILYAIVAAIARKKALVAPGLCREHKRRRLWALLGAWAGLLTGSAVLIAAAIHDNAVGMICGILFALSTTIAGIIVSRIVYPKKIDQDHVRLKGCGVPFLNSLAELPG